MDESRLGLHTVRRRRLTARGTKPVGIHQHRFKNFYVYGAIAPESGKNLFMVAPKMNTEVFQRFLEEFAAKHVETFNVLVVDNSKTHHAKELVVPPNVALLFQPPYAPEVNPAERVWQALKTGLAWRCFETIEALQERVVELLKGWEDDMLRSLTAYPYIMTALNALSP
jgi:transposase